MELRVKKTLSNVITLTPSRSNDEKEKSRGHRSKII